MMLSDCRQPKQQINHFKHLGTGSEQEVKVQCPRGRFFGNAHNSAQYNTFDQELALEHAL